MNRKMIPFLIMWMICILCLVVGIRTYPDKRARVNKEDCSIVRAAIKNIDAEHIRAGKYNRDTKYTVTYAYEGREYIVVYWHVFNGKTAETRDICIYNNRAYASYEELAHNMRVSAASPLCRISITLFYILSVFSIALFFGLKNKGYFKRM